MGMKFAAAARLKAPPQTPAPRESPSLYTLRDARLTCEDAGRDEKLRFRISFSGKCRPRGRGGRRRNLFDERKLHRPPACVRIGALLPPAACVPDLVAAPRRHAFPPDNKK